MRRAPTTIAVVSVLAVGACTVPPPSGPSVMALPAQGKSFEAFQQDDFVCRGFATQQTGGASASQAATNSAVGSAVLGTALGAGVGAAIGAVPAVRWCRGRDRWRHGIAGRQRDRRGQCPSSGAAVQSRYDIAYTQCMYSKGNSVQGSPGGYAAGFPGPAMAIGYGPSYYGFGMGPRW